MAKPRRPKTLAEQIADLDDPAPKDFDPEDVGAVDSESESDGSDEDGREDGARAHYEIVGKSKLRKPEAVSLGPQYAGSRISRDAIEEDEEDDPFGREYGGEDNEDEGDGLGSDASDDEEDEDALEGFEDNSEDEDMSEEGYGSQEEDIDGLETSGTEFSGEEEDVESSRPRIKDQNGAIDRGELRKLMAEDQKSVAATLSQSAKLDAEKGKAVKTQREAFDSLLNVRIKLQKALVSANTLSAVVTGEDSQLANYVVASAESAATKLWNNLNKLRSTLQTARTGKKRKHAELSSDTPLANFWEEMQSYESSQVPHRNSSLNFWSTKSRATTALPQARGRLNQPAKEQQLSDVLAAQLSDMPRLVAKTRVPRSCAPLQASSASKTKPTTNGLTNGAHNSEQLPIYDDADFYSTLLQSLISQRSSEATASLGNLTLNLQPWQAAREAKTKKVVDTKASKGRKLRYTVHEKLQNFMAPEDRGAWGERQSEELFSGLFGRRVGLGEIGEDDDEEMDEGGETEGLKLFAGA